MSEAAGSPNLESAVDTFDPSNPEALAALEKLAMGGVAVETPAIDPQDESVAKGEGGEKATEQQPASAGVTDQPRGVQAKDGQHIIPYSVLEKERDRASRAEQTAQALSEQLQKLQSGTVSAQTADANAVQLTDEDLSQLDTDLPGVAKVIRAQMQAIERLTGTVQTLQHGQESQQTNAEQRRRDEEEAAIAANENLTALREAMGADPKAQARWNRVVDTYQSLREDPDLFSLDIASLINKAEQSVATIYGPVAKAKPRESQAVDLKQAADAVLKAQPGAIPTSLSDFPGGIPPAQNDMETLSNASPIQLGQKFMSMTPDQIESYLARVTR